MEDWMTPLNEAENAIKEAKAALGVGAVKTMYEVLYGIPDRLKELQDSILAAVNESE